ncbi:hypothetical protein [uncultured Kordia sp.]|nr:hypothetical protein [uncultured Kordia sp.]
MKTQKTRSPVDHKQTANKRQLNLNHLLKEWWKNNHNNNLKS